MIFTQTEEKIDKIYKIEDFIKEEFLEEKDNFILHQSVIGYISGNKKNPLHNINVYSTKDDSIVKLLDSNLTKLMPQNFQETVLMIFYKDKNIDIREIKTKLK